MRDGHQANLAAKKKLHSVKNAVKGKTKKSEQHFKHLTLPHVKSGYAVVRVWSCSIHPAFPVSFLR